MQENHPQNDVMWVRRFGIWTQWILGFGCILFVMLVSAVCYWISPSLWFGYGGVYTGYIGLVVVYHNCFFRWRDLDNNNPKSPDHRTNPIGGTIRSIIAFPYGVLKCYIIYQIMYHTIGPDNAFYGLLYQMQAQFAFSGTDWFYTRGAAARALYNPKLMEKQWFRGLYSTLFQNFAAMIIIIVYCTKALDSNQIGIALSNFIMFGLAFNIGLGEWYDSLNWKSPWTRAGVMYFMCACYILFMRYCFTPLYQRFLIYTGAPDAHLTYLVYENVNGISSLLFPAFQIALPYTEWRGRTPGRRAIIATCSAMVWVVILYFIFSVLLPYWSPIWRNAAGLPHKCFPLNTQLICFAFMVGNTIYAQVTIFNGAGGYKKVTVKDYEADLNKAEHSDEVSSTTHHSDIDNEQPQIVVVSE